MIPDLNLQLFYWLHSLAGKNIGIDTAIVFFGHYYLFFLIVIALYVIHKDFHTSSKTHLHPWAKLTGLSATLIAIFTTIQTIHLLYPQLRPHMKLGVHNLLNITTPSFPSGHTIFIFGLATALYFYNKKLAVFMYVSGLVVGVARIIAGVHYPLDVLAGAALGTIIGICAMLICPLCVNLGQTTNRQRT